MYEIKQMGGRLNRMWLSKEINESIQRNVHIKFLFNQTCFLQLFVVVPEFPSPNKSFV